MGVNLFFFNDRAPTDIYTLPLPDALPILPGGEPIVGLEYGAVGVPFEQAPIVLDGGDVLMQGQAHFGRGGGIRALLARRHRSEEHTSELQSRLHLVCRLLLAKKKTNSTHS